MAEVTIPMHGSQADMTVLLPLVAGLSRVQKAIIHAALHAEIIGDDDEVAQLRGAWVCAPFQDEDATNAD